ncbi:CRISPR-associated endonuclease Cas2 [Haliangium sp.]|uniref:CRISPR-associated endonuclease Cas2 n=1 Tax=Haliangium sp. TaxID=2663208 RepID=UPI003D12BAD7
MPEPRHWYLFMYDVTEPKRLRAAHKILTQWGKPVQYSVFRTRCTARELERLRFELAEVLTQDDRLMVVRLCDNCAARVSLSGEPLASFELDTPGFHLV